MKILVGAAIVVLIALLGSRSTFMKIKLPMAARHIYLTGTEYILVGFILGGQWLGLLDVNSIEGLNPLLYLALGWIGLMFGIQLEVPQIRRFPTQYFSLSVTQALITGAFSFATIWLLMDNVAQYQIYPAVMGAVALSAVSIPTGQSLLAILHRERFGQRNKLSEILSYAAGLDAFISLLAFGLLYCYVRTKVIAGSAPLVAISYLLASLALGVVMGVILHLLTRWRCKQEELFLYTIGTVVFTTGAAAYLGLSPLFITAVGGFIIANAKGAQVRILRVLTSFEKPFYIIVLLLGGALVDIEAPWQVIVGLVVAFVLSRAVGKVFGGLISSQLLKTPLELPASLGFGLLSQGGITVAMAISFHQILGGSFAEVFLIVVLLSLFINELFSPLLADRVIRKAD